MSRTVTIAQRVRELQRLQADMPRVLARAAKLATMKAVEVAAENTPPKAGTGRGEHTGANMLTGELKAAWAENSIVEPVTGGGTYVTVLANEQKYASFVENGHLLNKHYVPGLYIDNNGNLAREIDPEKKKQVGLVVGTKTRWVRGEFMADKGKAAYHRAIVDLLDREIRRLRE